MSSSEGQVNDPHAGGSTGGGESARPSRFKAFMDECPDACILLDSHFRYVYMNSAAEAISRQSLDEIRGRVSPFIINADEHADIAGMYIAVMRDGRSRCVSRVAPGGSFDDREFRVRAFKVEGELGLIWTETTDARRAGDRIKAAQDEYRALALHVIDIQEAERKNIARELHDELGQILTSMNFGLRKIARDQAASRMPAREAVIDLVDRSYEAISAVRRISSELRPGILDHLGIKAAIEWLAADFAKSCDLSVTARIDVPEGAIDDRTATALFRITQEALTNIARHSLARVVSIRLHPIPGSIRLSIVDDGIGIGDDRANSSDSFGIIGMRERAHCLGGAFSVRGEAGRGTRLVATIPVRREGQGN
jgi:signal transduction histidine kinase